MAENYQGFLDDLTRLSRELNANISPSRELASALANLKKTEEDAANQTGKTATQIANEAATFKTAKDNVKLLIATEREHLKLTAALTKATKGYSAGMKELWTTTKAAGSGLMKFAGLFGATSISINDAKKNLLDYNRNMYNLSRTQQLVGHGMEDYVAVQKMVSTQTKLSQRQTAELFGEFAKGYRGIAPTNAAMGALATTMWSKLGRSVESLKQGFKELSEIQDKFPAMVQNLTSLTQQLQSGKIDEASYKSGISQIQMLGFSAGLSTKQMSVLSQMKVSPSVKTDKLTKLEEAMLGVGQKSEDSMLKLAQAIEGPVTRMVNALEKVAASFGHLPPLIMASVGALGMLKLPDTLLNQMGALLPGMGKLGKASAGSFFKNATGSLKGVSGGAVGKLGGGLATAGYGLVEGYRGYNKGKDRGYDTETSAVSGVVQGGGALAGGLAGAKLGALLGSFAGPVGTGIGGIIGGIGGAAGGAWLGSKASDSIVPEKKKEAENAAKAAKAAEEAAEAAGEQSDELQKSLASIEAIKANYEMSMVIIDKMVQAEQKRLDIMAKSGQLNRKATEGAFDTYIASLEDALQRTRDFASDFNNEMQKIGQSTGIDFGDAFKGLDIESAIREGMPKAITTMQDSIKQLQSQASKLKIDMGEGKTQEEIAAKEKLDEVLKKIGITQGAIGMIQANHLQYDEKQNELATTRSQKLVQYADTQRNFNSIFEERLGIERELMEAAQFGMGASISMMQKQVDLAYSQIDAEQVSMENIQKRNAEIFAGVLGSKEAGDAAADELSSSKDGKDIQAVILKYKLDQTVVGMELTKNAENYQKTTSNIMQQQKKIYDLTKDIREGYLDAVREMSTGAGEFEKIIGMQDMGVSQLMKTVKSVTGEDTLNTMKLGGVQAKGDTAAGIGTTVTGRYGATPGGSMLGFINPRGGGDSQEARNKRITGYQESINQFNAMKNGTGARSQVGSGQADEQYLRPYQEEKQLQRDATKEGMVLALKEVGVGNGRGFQSTQVNGNIMGAINPAFSGPGSSGRFGTDERQSPTSGSNLGARLAAGTKAPLPADVSGGTRRASDGRVTSPQAQTKESKEYTEYLASKQKIDRIKEARSKVEEIVKNPEFFAFSNEEKVAAEEVAIRTEREAVAKNETRMLRLAKLDPSAITSEMKQDLSDRKKKLQIREGGYQDTRIAQTAFNELKQVSKTDWSGQDENVVYDYERKYAPKDQSITSIASESGSQENIQFKRALKLRNEYMDIKRKRGQSEGDFRTHMVKEGTRKYGQRFGQAFTEGMTTKQAEEAQKMIDQFQSDAQVAASISPTKAKQASSSLVMEDHSGNGTTSFISEAQRKGQEASEGDQAVFSQAISGGQGGVYGTEQASGAGIEGAGSGGGGGMGFARVIIALSPELAGEIAEVKDMVAQIQQAGSRTNAS